MLTYIITSASTFVLGFSMRRQSEFHAAFVSWETQEAYEYYTFW